MKKEQIASFSLSAFSSSLHKEGGTESMIVIHSENENRLRCDLGEFQFDIRESVVDYNVKMSATNY
jgi:hypothetical protein